MITAMSLTNGTLTVIIDNGANIIPVRNDNPRWAELIELYKQFDVSPDGKLVGPEDKLLSLLSLKSIVETYSSGKLSVNSTGVTFRGQPMHGIDSSRVLAFLRDGLPFKPIANYMARKMANPSARAIVEMYPFLEHKNMPITPEGKIIAYKGVQDNFYSVRGNTQTVVVQGVTDSAGHILNEIGKVIEIERGSCDDDFRNGCSFGLHAGSLAYAKGWGVRVLLVEIDPADVVSIPEDCNCQKLRCCKYKVLGEYTGPMPEAYTDEFASAPSTTNHDDHSEDQEEDQCSNCGEDESYCSCESEDCGDDYGNDLCVGCQNPKHECNCYASCNCQDCTESKPSKVSVPPAVNIAQEIASISEAILTRCSEMISEHMYIHPDEMTPDFLLSEIAMTLSEEAELAVRLEQEFDTQFPHPELENIFRNKMLSDLVAYIYQKLNPTSLGESYLQGMQEGVRDRAAMVSPTYVPGDVNGADSTLHEKFIEGYITGYA